MQCAFIVDGNGHSTATDRCPRLPGVQARVSDVQPDSHAFVELFKRFQSCSTEPRLQDARSKSAGDLACAVSCALVVKVATVQLAP